VMGTLIAIPSLGALGVLGWADSQSIDWERHKPLWWVVWDAQAKEIAARDMGIVELTRRWKGRALTRAQVAYAVEGGLSGRGQAERPWVLAWGNLIEEARGGGMVSEEQWRRYTKQAMAGWIAWTSDGTNVAARDWAGWNR